MPQRSVNWSNIAPNFVPADNEAIQMLKDFGNCVIVPSMDVRKRYFDLLTLIECPCSMTVNGVQQSADNIAPSCYDVISSHEVKRNNGKYDSAISYRD